MEVKNNDLVIEFIEFCLMFRGHIKEADLTQRFSISEQAAKQILTDYQESFTENLFFDDKLTTWFQNENFKLMSALTVSKAQNFLRDSGVNSGIQEGHLAVESGSLIHHPDISIFSRLVRAITNGNTVNIIYTSLSSGSASRDIIPHSIVDDGLRWHVRAYDRKSESFRDFVLTRISKVSIRSNEVYSHERKDVDWQWQNILELEIVPHPHNVNFPTAVEMEYGMDSGRLVIKARAAMAGYLLRRWNVDCSVDAVLTNPEYLLHLRNRSLLESVENLSIAPGYHM
jgi:hypothetical protein